ncbi:Eukaryotic elongation factor 2 kinase [Balamuthia mandrillaris]
MLRQKFATLVQKAVETSVDPFEDFDTTAVPTEAALRYGFDPRTQTWHTEPVLVKIEPEPFASGAVRNAYRMKVYEGHWHHGRAWVAKRYKEEVVTHQTQQQEGDEEDGKPAVLRKLYQDDVKLQMHAKYLGELYNERNPPKKVDFISVWMLEMVDRPNKELYCIEAYIEGDYVKHNTNSGYVELEHWRHTPHCFSHFTFECTQNKLLVCDIQGVNDLYTDPQLHSWDGKDFGTGNLGPRGIALFLYSHECNGLCKLLGLTPFDLYEEPEKPILRRQMKPLKGKSLTQSFSNLIRIMDEDKTKASSELQQQSNGGGEPNSSRSRLPKRLLHASDPSTKPTVIPIPDPSEIPEVPTPAAFIHLELGRCHESGRLNMLEQLFQEHDSLKQSAEHPLRPNLAAAFYHYQQAAHGGLVSAQLLLARVLSGRPGRSVLPSLDIEDQELCFMYLLLAAHRGSTDAMYHVAMFYKEGTCCEQDTGQSSTWFEKLLDSSSCTAVAEESERYGWDAAFMRYELLASLAELYQSGGDSLPVNYARAAELFQEAADEAAAVGKGKLAQKYFEQADLCESM